MRHKKILLQKKTPSPGQPELQIFFLIQKSHRVLNATYMIRGEVNFHSGAMNLSPREGEFFQLFAVHELQTAGFAWDSGEAEIGDFSCPAALPPSGVTVSLLCQYEVMGSGNIHLPETTSPGIGNVCFSVSHE